MCANSRGAVDTDKHIRLKFIQLLMAGFDLLLRTPIVTDTQIPIANTSGIHGPVIAEWIIMAWLVAGRKYNLMYELQKQASWAGFEPFFSVSDLVGKTVGILGYGSIGRQVARVATALGMTVSAFTFSPRDTPESRRDNGYVIPGTGDADGSLPASWYSGHTKADLHAFLAQGLDHLVLTVPLTPQTANMIGDPELALLSSSLQTAATPPPTATSAAAAKAPFLTNVCRGEVLDQDALLRALQSGVLAGAAIDVAVPEPLPAEHPLWRAPNLQIAPHISFLSTGYVPRTFDILKVNVARFRRGEEPINLLQRARGY